MRKSGRLGLKKKKILMGYFGKIIVFEVIKGKNVQILPFFIKKRYKTIKRRDMKIKDGFSLVELTVVILLCIIIMGLGASCGSFIYRGLVKQEAEKLALVCRYLQHAAMMSNETKTLIFDRKQHCYRYDSCSVKLSNQVEFGVLEGSKGPPSNPTRLIESPISFKNEKIIFYPDGIIQPGTVYLIGKNTQIMYALSCPISQVSYVRIYKYDGSWQCVS
jgi:hypothetical protein